MNVSAKIFSLVFCLLFFATIQPVIAMSEKAYESLEVLAERISTPYASAKECGLSRTAEKLFDAFSRTVMICELRETQLIKLERILSSAKGTGKCDDLEKVEKEAIAQITLTQMTADLTEIRRSVDGATFSCGSYLPILVGP